MVQREKKMIEMTLVRGFDDILNSLSLQKSSTFGKSWSRVTIASVRRAGPPQARRENRTNLKLEKLTKRKIFTKV